MTTAESESNWPVVGEQHPPGLLDESVAELLTKEIERIGDRPIEMNFNGDWERPSGQSIVPSGQPTILERRKFDTKTGTYLGLGVLTVGAALTAYYTYRHIQKKKQ